MLTGPLRFWLPVNSITLDDLPALLAVKSTAPGALAERVPPPEMNRLPMLLVGSVAVLLISRMKPALIEPELLTFTLAPEPPLIDTSCAPLMVPPLVTKVSPLAAAFRFKKEPAPLSASRAPVPTLTVKGVPVAV